MRIARDTPYVGRAVHQQVWFRHIKRLPDDQNTHVSALAYMSDMTLLGSARVAHPGVDTQVASLDHAMWFYHEFEANDWLLYVQESPASAGGRGMNFGHFFTRDGKLIATAAQEGLIRVRD